mmetsp:Transcript_3225/g.13234  ORF Transcript_3225/g.13234 Transcript_3225/m.13234 type:complete len:380 (-) Transcript_3225:3548-4687(-)
MRRHGPDHVPSRLHQGPNRQGGVLQRRQAGSADDDERLLRCGCRIPCWLGTGGSPWREPGRSAVRLRERALGERALPSRTSKDGVRSLPTLQTSPRLSVAGSQLRGNPRQEANPTWQRHRRPNAVAGKLTLATSAATTRASSRGATGLVNTLHAPIADSRSRSSSTACPVTPITRTPARPAASAVAPADSSRDRIAARAAMASLPPMRGIWASSVTKAGHRRPPDRGNDEVDVDGGGGDGSAGPDTASAESAHPALPPAGDSPGGGPASTPSTASTSSAPSPNSSTSKPHLRITRAMSVRFTRSSSTTHARGRGGAPSFPARRSPDRLASRRSRLPCRSSRDWLLGVTAASPLCRPCSRLDTGTGGVAHFPRRSCINRL